jgi:hypothetical protein
LFEFYDSHGDGTNVHAIASLPDSGFAFIASDYTAITPGLSYKSDLVIQRFDTEGALMWKKVIDNVLLDVSTQYLELCYQDNHLYALCNFYLIKLSIDGDLIWSKNYTMTNGDYSASGMAVSSDGSIFIHGRSYGEDNLVTHLVTSKVNSEGDLIWNSKNLYGYSNRCSALDQNSDRLVTSYRVFGEDFSTEVEGIQIQNDQGILLWNNFISHDSLNISFNDILLHGEHIYALGTLKDDIHEKILILKLHENGSILWQKAYSSANINLSGKKFQLKSDTELIVIGSTQNFIQETHALLNISTDGELFWANTVGESTNPRVIHDLEILSDGSLILAGNLLAIPPDNSNGPGHLCIMKLDSSGYSPCGVEVLDILVENVNLQVTQETVSPGSVEIGSVEIELFFADESVEQNFLCSETLKVSNVDSENGLIIYPNPSDGQVRIDFQTTALTDLSIFNSEGSLVFNRSQINNKSQLDLSFLPKGIYFLRFNSEGDVYTQKLVILH